MNGENTMKRHHMAAALVSLAVMALAFGGPASAAHDNALKKMNAATLSKMLSGGMFGYLDRSTGAEVACAAVMVNAAPDRVWTTLTAYENYPRIIAQISKVKILERKADGAKITMTAYIMRVGPINITSEGTQVMKYTGKSHIEMASADAKDKKTWGTWDLIPAEGGRKTILIYAYNSDIAAGGGTAKALIDKEPTLGISINMSNVMVMVEGIKKGAEKK